MLDLQITKATRDDAVEMAVVLNFAQVDSILALGDKTVDDAINRSLSGSTHAWAGRVNGELVAIWGVYPLADGIGYPWMYSTLDLRGVPKLTFNLARRVLDDMLTLYPRLFGMVDSENEPSVRFAKKLGFTIGPFDPDPRFKTIERRATV